MNPIETRESIVRYLERSLFGPKHGEASNWLGKNSPHELVIKDGVTWDQPRPVGHWVNEENEEVLATPPFFVYGVGILFPKISAKVQSEIDGLLASIALNDSDDDSGSSLKVSELDEDDAEADIDDGVQSAESTTRPRSMAISIRVPIGLESISVELSGGTYSAINVLQQQDSWWSRKAHFEHQTISVLESNETQISFANVTLTLGASIRRLDADTKIATIWIRNDTVAADATEFSSKCLFQTSLSLLADEILPYDQLDSEQITSLDLLYRDELRLATGHGIDAVAEKDGSKWRIKSSALPTVRLQGLTPDVPYAVGMVDLAEFNSDAINSINNLIQDYELWISEKEQDVSSLPSEYSQVANQHLAGCRDFLKRIRAGWGLVQSNEDVQKVLRDMSMAMNRQRIAYNAPLRKVESFSKAVNDFVVAGDNPHFLHDDFEFTKQNQSRWRAFQIAFILASLEKVLNPADESGAPVDVIWMPTGGGKTEAYLGLAGFVILWERLKCSKLEDDIQNKQFTKVFMRYTLRLLTSQQLTRAASLICALEITRQANPDLYGTNVIRIGAWLGSATSPNDYDSAGKLYGKILKNASEGKSFMMTRCPWCGTQMGEVFGDQIAGYRKVAHPANIRIKRVIACCPSKDCQFTFEEVQNTHNTLFKGIPVFEVDEDIYASPPDFVVGTLDKVARIAWVPKAQSLFGLRKGERKAPAPRLFIQDELHLIAGPLGSIDGAFEALLEHLCLAEGGSRPVIVASTATTKNFENQLDKLYGRSGALIPPPGLEISDSFFAKREANDAGKIYVAVCASGYGSNLSAQTKVLGMLAHAGGILRNLGEKSDPWWTNIVFFSSRRALGQLHSQIETGLRSVISRLRTIGGASSGPKVDPGRTNNDSIDDAGFRPTRLISNLKQLTSTSSDNLNQVLDNLSLSVEDSAEQVIDICLATSMIEVGLDVPRLGLMTVIGQPKSASQYIQVSGRVGRSAKCPGLIVTVLAPHNVRDRSHYEGFSDWHHRLYASVENSSVTPFTSRALERSAPSVLTALLRIFGDEKSVKISYEKYWDSAIEVLMNRAQSLGSQAEESLTAILVQLKRLITSPDAFASVWDKHYGNNQFFVYGADDVIPPERIDSAHWRILNSMRNVEGDSGFRMQQVAMPVRENDQEDQASRDSKDFEL